MREIPERAVTLIKSWEGFRMNPYRDMAGVWSQGYGTTKGITADSHPIDEKTAESYLRNDLEDLAQQIEDMIAIDLTNNQFAALLSLTYNVGGAPLRLTLGRLLNEGNFEAAGKEFLRWDYVHINGKAVQSNGLLNRRKAEYELFMTPDIPVA